MSRITSNQPEGTPTWIDLGIPDLDRAMEFYGAVFGWEFDVGPEQAGRYTTCLLDGRRIAALMPHHDAHAEDFWWNVYFASPDVDATARHVTEAGGTVVNGPMDVMEQGRMAVAHDPTGASFGLWQGRAHIGCELVNEPGALLRNDLFTSAPGVAREFYSAVFGYTLDRNKDLPEDTDFTFLRRPDGHEIGGVFGSSLARSMWATTFEVADTDAAVDRARAAGGQADAPEDIVYGRIAAVADPFGTRFSVITRPA